jgi:Protein of unknown function (DUF1592)/Protein of unknown function (DUF1588)/Protein of unknown function (DUF1587)/Protein of unknown function (DUF1585)/Protein of unknown function (DUF1595)/Planctomycete cytochrome C
MTSCNESFRFAIIRIACVLGLAFMPDRSDAAAPFADTVRPFLRTHCVRCHNAKKPSAELDLDRFGDSTDIATEFRVWELVLSAVSHEEMPPEAAKPPSAKDRKAFVDALRKLLLVEARRTEGDPGPVSPRRLSNAEYDTSIFDLTGADIRPAKEFPVDPASGEGFDNTSEALVMSPGLFKKQYAAAEHVADHALLTATGLAFAPHPVVSFADRQKYAEQAIIRFYDSHSVDYATYFEALRSYRHRSDTMKDLSVEVWAVERRLSRRYARSLWDALEKQDEDIYFLGWLRERWKALPADPAAARDGVRKLADDILKLSRELGPKENPAIVANAGNGPIEHLARRARTAAARGTFDPANLAKLSVAIPGLPADGLTPAVRSSGDAYCQLFPNRFVSVDATRGLSAGFHLIEGFFRDDAPLGRLVLDEAENKELDRLWNELEFSTGIMERMLRGFVFFERSERNFLKHRDFDDFKEEDPNLTRDETLARFQDVYLKRSGVKATGEELARHPIHRFFSDIRAGLKKRAATLESGRSAYKKDLLAFAERAYRQPLSAEETRKIEAFYDSVCHDPEQGVEAAVRATIVRILVSPKFAMLYHPAPPGGTIAPLPDLALASRLSYFIWSGPPDAELITLAKAGRLRDERILREQVRRMTRDPKVDRFAREFFGQWLGYRDFATRESVDRNAFPKFDDSLKAAMIEEPTRLIAAILRNDESISQLLNGDITYVNRSLAAHYGLPFRGTGDEWVRVGGLRKLGRSGLFGMPVVLARNSQPQRTSPVKRGFWVVHKLLGEHIPPPPPDVAVLPAKETDTNGKTIRELLASHVADARCAKCHQRFDSLGLAMEGFDPIGRARTKDLAGRPIDDRVRLPDGRETRGVPEFADHLAKHRLGDFTATLCRKFLGYALGRSLLLSDQPLLDRMRAELESNGHRMSALFELVATSPQFRNQRCQDFSADMFRKTSTGANP